jgi:hypothetical protein
MTSDSVIEIPGIDRRHQRRRLQLIEVGVVALVALILIFLMPAVLPSVRPEPDGTIFGISDRSPRY